jgi:hypothetical protein
MQPLYSLERHVIMLWRTPGARITTTLRRRDSRIIFWVKVAVATEDMCVQEGPPEPLPSKDTINAK